MAEGIFQKLNKIAVKLGGNVSGNIGLVDAIESIEEAKGGVKGDAKTIAATLDQLYDMVEPPSGENLSMYMATVERTVTLFSSPGLSVVGINAFAGCTSLTSVDLPEVLTLGTSAFASCYSLASVNLPAATTIGDYAFGDCSNLTTISLPAATTIGDGAFYNCVDLMSVYMLGSSVPTLGSNAFYSATSFYVAESMYDAFCSASGWSDMSSRIVSVPASSAAAE